MRSKWLWLLPLLLGGAAWAQPSPGQICTLSGNQTTGYVLTATNNSKSCSWQTVGGSSVSADTVKNAIYCPDTGSANAIVCTTTTSYPGSYAAGQMVIVKMAASNSGATTITIAALAAKAVTKFGSTALASGNLINGQEYALVYDGTRFQVLNPTLVAADFPTLVAAGVCTVTFSSGAATWPNAATGASGSKPCTQYVVLRTAAITSSNTIPGGTSGQAVMVLDSQDGTGGWFEIRTS